MVAIPASDPLLRAFREHVRAFSVFRRGESILLAVSGGLTSTALAHLCVALKEEWHLGVHLGHIQETPETEESVRELATSLRLPLATVAVGAVTEEIDGAFDPAPLLALPGVGRIATGETKDHAEEIEIVRFLSGRDLEDEGWFEPASGRLVRPLVHFRRDECREFLRRANIPYHQSPARLLPTRTVDRVRLLLMPLIRHHIEPSLSVTLAERRRLLRDDAVFLRDLATAARTEVGWTARPTEVTLTLSKFRTLPAALRRRILRDAFRHVAPEADLPPRALLRLDAELQETTADPLRRDLPPLSITRSGDTLSVRRL